MFCKKSKERCNEMMLKIAATIKEKTSLLQKKYKKAISELLPPIGKKELNLSSGRETDGTT